MIHESSHNVSPMSILVESHIQTLKPYKAGKPIEELKREFLLSKVIKLASNENPLGPSPKSLKAIKEHLTNLHRYPDPGAFELTQSLSAFHKIDSKCFILGNGSNELIDLLVRVFASPGEAILVPEYSFIAYAISAQAAGLKVVRSDVSPVNFKVSLDAIYQQILTNRKTSNQSKIRLVFLPNPNNPTGHLIPHEEMLWFLEKTLKISDLLVVVDEAYHEFVRDDAYQSLVGLQEVYPHLMVTRTFSKAYGLAGLRIGYLVGREQLVGFMHRVRNPFNINELAQVAATAALDDHDFVKKSQEITWEGLDQLYKHFSTKGVSFFLSQGNFLLVDCKKDAQGIYLELLKKGIILRPVDNYGLSPFLRFSVGLPEENREAADALVSLL